MLVTWISLCLSARLNGCHGCQEREERQEQKMKNQDKRNAKYEEREREREEMEAQLVCLTLAVMWQLSDTKHQCLLHQHVLIALPPAPQAAEEAEREKKKEEEAQAELDQWKHLFEADTRYAASLVCCRFLPFPSHKPSICEVGTNGTEADAEMAENQGLAVS